MASWLKENDKGLRIDQVLPQKEGDNWVKGIQETVKDRKPIL